MAWIGILNGFFISIILFLKSKEYSIKYFLAGFLLSLSIVLAGCFYLSTELSLLYPHFIYLHSPFNFCVGPLLYFFTKFMVTPSASLRVWPHFIPFLGSIAFHLPFYLLGSGEKITFLKSALQELPLSRELFFWAVILQGSIYITLTIRLLIERNKFPSKKLYALSFSFTLFLAILVLIALLRKAIHYSYEHSFFGPSIIIFWMTYTYYILINPKQFQTRSQKKRKYHNSGLHPKDVTSFLNAFLEYIQREKPYLNQQFTLKVASKYLDIHPNHLSQSINQKLRRSFTEVVNEYRIKEAVNLIKDPAYQHFSIEGIAKEVGFKSKSAFYAHFKKHIGKNPKELRKKFE